MHINAMYVHVLLIRVSGF